MENTKNTVLIDLQEYKEFIVSQYENGKLKKTLNQEIKELKKEKLELEEAAAEIKALFTSTKHKVLEMAINGEDWKYESRNRQINHIDEKNIYISYPIFTRETQEILIEVLGYSKQDLKDFVNKKYDEKEAGDNKETVNNEK